MTTRLNQGRTDPTRKFCHQCKTEKSTSEFGRNRCKYDGLQAYCKPCCSAYHKAKGYKSNPGHERRWKYGIEHETCLEMLAAQGGRCAICSDPISPYGNRADTFNLDHDHETGAIRSLLCRHCNAMLGLARDNPEILRRAILYLEGHSDEE